MMMMLLMMMLMILMMSVCSHRRRLTPRVAPHRSHQLVSTLFPTVHRDKCDRDEDDYEEEEKKGDDDDDNGLCSIYSICN